MLYISTSKIHKSTVGASFTVSFSVAPDEIGYLTALHEKYAEMNMRGFTIKPNCSEKPNNCTNCECTNDCSECKEAEHGCKDEPTISKMEQVDKDTNVRNKDCETCRYESLESYEGACDDCTDISGSPSNYEPKTEPQTERSNE